MIEFNAYIGTTRAPQIFVNDIGGIYRLGGGIIQVTLLKQFEEPNRRPVEQGSLIWPEASWFHYAGMLHWARKEIERGTLRRDIPQLRPH